MLGLEGHDVRMVYNGVDALALAEHFRPQIVLLEHLLKPVDPRDLNGLIQQVTTQ
jgi:CheY-like chemotaxis protein